MGRLACPKQCNAHSRVGRVFYGGLCLFRDGLGCDGHVM
ncbi:uncharacterized protein G2W53_042444 [Senna tora]|uniref:Uncharacterized protein n=1 Tax=Senna tora TaxID=362788 RepID=A0A834SG05_9FABA|nr:uncharacterized protein G2W53_042444 [Senna tora]